MFTRQELKKLSPYIRQELALAQDAQGTPTQAFHHLESAHVLGQYSTFWHVYVHMKMFMWAFAHRRPKELLGQLLRMAGALTKTPFGIVPKGNTGGANISPFRRLPWSNEHEAIFHTIKNET